MAKNKEQTKKLAAKQPVMPSKTTMNLAFHESTVDPKRIIPVIIVLAVAALLLLKFGIIDPTAERVQAYNQLQFMRKYYTFHDVDVAPYELDGKLNVVFLAAREMNKENL